ncbi:iron complex transport system substrate-binding protein [Paenibacillus tianmuensis]|uniref:Iron complex transport system substrate-binding protein n=1 Tax=Paenibacillus tianmuensis TaxID=624147 RepID=A0A1G4SA76_9BACL|nr:AraC family transcriptional regulator [Paenibacillus tianmuensis]SCW65928.1 iron complex transport system substrate-binding protein [Paenibacillus tianmuensis]
MNWDEQMLLWNQAAVRILDIRYKVLWEGQDLLSYQLPANIFLFVVSGSAYLRIDERKCYLKRHHLLHAGKGMNVDIMPAKHEFSFYLVYYKAVLPTSMASFVANRLIVQAQPFGLFYHVILPEPGLVHRQFRRMYEEWQQSGVLAQVLMKSMLFEFIYELFSQLQNSKDRGSPSDLVAYALRYIHEHYTEAVTMDQLADLLGCSSSYMYRLFKAETGKSPNDYIIGIRMEQARQYLLTTQLNLREIARSVGYSDVYYFSRLFKKQFGVSPLQSRKRESENNALHLNPLNTSRSSIVPPMPLSYNHNVNENDYHDEGEMQLISNNRPKSSMTALVMLCLSLLISACQAGNNNVRSESKGSTESSSTTRIYKHKYGETQIPAKPKRVVTAYHLGHMLALGVRPLGAATYILQYSKSTMDTTGVVDLGAPLNLELIANLEPDLIILIDAYLEPSGGYEGFNKIAPTVVLEANQDPVKDIRLIGDLLNKQEEAKQWITQFEDKIAQTKKRVKQMFGPDETFTILNVRSEKARMIYRDRNMGGNILYTYWGLKPQEKVLEDVINGIDDESSYLNITEEAIPEYVGDHLIVAAASSAQDSVDKLMASGLWKNLDAVKNNHVYRIDFDQFLFNDPIFAMKQVDVLADVLTKNR